MKDGFTDASPKNKTTNLRCLNCSDKSFSSRSALKRHVKHFHSKDDSTCYLCIVCPSKFRCRSELVIHTSTKHGDNRFLCKKCGKSYTSKVGLHYHKETIHEEISGRKLKCEVEECNFFYRSNQHYERHLGNVHNKKLQCLVCLQHFAHSFSLKNHKCPQKVMPPNQIKCIYEKCDRTFKEKKYMQAHVNVEHLNKKVVCKICAQTFKHRSALLRHKQKDHPQPLDNYAEKIF